MIDDSLAPDTSVPNVLEFRGGHAGALASFALFLAGVAALGLSGAPDERGLWPVLVAAIALGLSLARDRHRYCEALVEGIAQPIVALMILAWLLAGIFGALLTAGGLVDGLVWAAQQAGLSGSAWVVASFLVCCAFSSATGTSFGTMILCTPLLYPAGAAVGASPVMLAGAIIGGATFGDNLSPVSDTTIASAMTQGADIGGVVRSRIRYALPAAALALLGYALLGGNGDVATAIVPAGIETASGLLLLLAPLVAIILLLRKRHLIEGLLAGAVVAVAVGIVTGQLAMNDLLHLAPDQFGARGLIVDGIERSLGISVFTILLMGLVGTIEATGLLDRLVEVAQGSATSRRRAEAQIVAAVSGAVLLTTHSVVAILAVGRLARETGAHLGIGPYRRANLLDTTVCTFPFLLPYFVPTILAASLTVGGEAYGMPRLSALQVGFANLHSWALLAMVVFAVVSGYGSGHDDA